MTTIGFPLTTMSVFFGLTVIIWMYDVASCQKKHGILSFTDSVIRSVLYVSVAMLFAAFLAMAHGVNAVSLFLSGYVMEKVLSIDNLIVFAAVFAYFRVPPKDQPWILQYGFLGAIVFRLMFITIGVGSLFLFGRVTEFIFGALVAWSAWGLYQASGEENTTDYDATWYVRLARKLSIHPAFICLVAIEITDVMFAFDSVPAVIAITQDPLLIFSAMIFAILGLRALYFVLAALRQYVVYLDKAVIVVLLFIASKLIGHSLWDWQISPIMSCGIVLSLLAVGIGASMIKPVGEAL